MTKKELVKVIIDLEYTEEQQQIKGLVKARTADLMRDRKEFLERRVVHLKNNPIKAA